MTRSPLRSLTLRSILLALALAGVAPACGGDDPPGSPDGGALPVGPLLPLRQGATWTYTVTDPATGATKTKTSTVEVLEDVGGPKAGVMAWRVRTAKPGEATLSWQEDTGEAIVRHKEQELDGSGTAVREEYYAPSKLRVDESAAHTAVGASWTEAYIETVNDLVTGQTSTVSKQETWSVVALEEVTVPAGTFTGLRVRRISAGGSDKTYWFVPNVGKVKETGGQTEELSSYTIP